MCPPCRMSLLMCPPTRMSVLMCPPTRMSGFTSDYGRLVLFALNSYFQSTFSLVFYVSYSAVCQQWLNKRIYNNYYTYLSSFLPVFLYVFLSVCRAAVC